MYRWIIYILMFSFTSGPSRISQFFRSTRVDERFLPTKYPLSIKALGAKLHRTLVSAKLALAFLFSHTPLVEKTNLEIWFAEKTGQSELKRVFSPSSPHGQWRCSKQSYTGYRSIQNLLTTLFFHAPLVEKRGSEPDWLRELANQSWEEVIFLIVHVSSRGARSKIA
jgi:hypothetical protein